MKSPIKRRLRLDESLVERGLAPSIDVARRLIMAGAARDGDRLFDKPGMLISEDQALTVKGQDCPFVSWGGIKLAHGLEVFGVNPYGLRCLDIGASTGGFCDVLLKKGAAHVTALDVGYGILAWKVRSDDRVEVIERTNFRIVSDDFFKISFDLITADVSFISLNCILTKAVNFLRKNGAIIALIKPQFEARADQVEAGGFVRDPSVHRDVIVRLASKMAEHELFLIDFSPVPAVQSMKNREFISLWRQGPLDIPALDEAGISRRLLRGQ
ncbi:MAG: TlyA family RNA methyltransferase [Candidatus Riflebacteria bacterium]|nr:TlyA family RNA methyltransferase [Candidatus Riflebacteria bacterium]